MTTTPTIWKSSFNPGVTSLSGNQTVPQTIGLANGNILVVWQDDTDPTRPFTDIMGQILSPEGIASGPAFQVNAAVWGGDETGPQIVALPDGGFVMAYGGYLEALGGFITVERFNSAGQTLYSNVITDAAGSLTDFWKITADPAGNYTLVFERVIPVLVETEIVFSVDVHSFTYDFATNLRGPEHTNLAQNSTELDRLGAAATFANGHILSFTNEPDFNFFGLDAETAEFAIIDPVTGALIRNVEVYGDPPYEEGIAKDAAVLSGGQFVLVYLERSDVTEYTYVFKVGLSETGSIGPRVVIPTAGAVGGVHVVALQDGGFFIAWKENGSQTLYGQRYGAYGDAIGAHFPFATNVGVFAPSDLGLTADGRILVSYRTNAGEVAEVILDPRETTIFGTGSGDVLTTQSVSTLIFGEGGNDRILGQGGNDSIFGGEGFDTLSGGSGNDTFHLNDATAGFEFDVVVEGASGGTDTVIISADGLDPGILFYYALTDNVEHGIVVGFAGIDLGGNGLANSLTGNSATNYLFGLGGRDTLNGGGGADALYGGDGNDIYELYDTTDVAGLLSFDTVVESAGGGSDTVRINSNALALGKYGLGANVEIGIITGNAIFTLRGNGLNNQLVGNSVANALAGGAGSDRLQGAGGVDLLTGGAGPDSFVFTVLTDSGIGAGQRDTIVDFAAGDVIDVSRIDANSVLGGNQAFKLDSNGVRNAGDIFITSVGANLLVSFNTDADAAFEMQIIVKDRAALTAADFLL